MSGTWMFATPRRIRRGAGLTFLFAGVLVTGAATGSWGGGAQGAAGDSGSGVPIGAVAGDAEAPASGPDGRSGDPRSGGDGQAAEELVSRSGDRWSAAYTAREYEGLQQTLEGEYVGVGISVERAHNAEGGRAVGVGTVQPGSPADEAGIRAGDRLRAVDGEKAAGMPVTEVVALLRGSTPSDPAHLAEPGSTVALVLYRDGHRWSETLERARLTAETVTVERLAEDVTRIEVTAFTDGTGERVRRAVAEIPAGSGILLDLRGNCGGLVSEATAAASAFLDGGLVATYDDKGTQRALYAEPGGNTEAPLAVLVDGGTMSAAELLTGALQDRGRALVVGSRTFGKGSVQVPRTMTDGSVAELTVGHYTTPSGRAVHGKGLTPDLAVRPGTAAEREARKVLSGLTPGV